MLKNTSSQVKSIVLLLAVLVLIISSAAWYSLESDNYFPVLFYTIILCIGGYMMANSRKWLIIYCGLAALAITTTFGNHWLAQSANTLASTMIYLMLFVEIVKQSFFKPAVTRIDQIVSGIVGYLLLGLFWLLQFKWLEIFNITSIKSTSTDAPLHAADQLYFTFVTLTTLGYGDMVPASPMAKIITILIAISGVLYLAIFIACIIGRKEN